MKRAHPHPGPGPAAVRAFQRTHHLNFWDVERDWTQGPAEPCSQAEHLGAIETAGISLIWRRYDGRQLILYPLDDELASHNCKGERENEPERKFPDAARQIAAEEDTW